MPNRWHRAVSTSSPRCGCQQENVGDRHQRGVHRSARAPTPPPARQHRRGLRGRRPPGPRTGQAGAPRDRRGRPAPRWPASAALPAEHRPPCHRAATRPRWPPTAGPPAQPRPAEDRAARNPQPDRRRDGRLPAPGPAAGSRGSLRWSRPAASSRPASSSISSPLSTGRSCSSLAVSASPAKRSIPRQCTVPRRMLQPRRCGRWRIRSRHGIPVARQCRGRGCQAGRARRTTPARLRPAEPVPARRSRARRRPPG